MAGIDARRPTYTRISSALAALDDADFAKIMQQGTSRRDWAPSYPVEFNGERLFVKRVPVTEVEHARWPSTANHHGVPTYYQYGVGSFGTNVVRELAAHIATTQWVLDGEATGFPMLFHHRLLERPIKPCWPDEEQRRAVHYWADSDAIARRCSEQATADREIFLVLEYIPYRVHEWLAEHQSRSTEILTQTFTCIDQLRAHGYVHFDAHLGNVLTDGEQTYLTDFGLVLGTDFQLTASERDFLGRHAHYDYAEILHSIAALRPLLETCERGYLSVVDQYIGVIDYMTRFYDDLRANPKKDTRYDDAVIAALLP